MNELREAWLLTCAFIVMGTVFVTSVCGDPKNIEAVDRNPGLTLEAGSEVYKDLKTSTSRKSRDVVPVPKTGQTTSYEEGDDGDLQKGMDWPNPRFTVVENTSDEETVLDNLTGLMWMRNAKILGKKNWSDALSRCRECTAGGYRDWRLPNRTELLSLVHLGYDFTALPNTAGTGKWIEGDPFLGVQPWYYWSSTTSAKYKADAWGVHLFSGDVGYYNKSVEHFVWCVRNGAQE